VVPPSHNFGGLKEENLEKKKKEFKGQLTGKWETCRKDICSTSRDSRKAQKEKRKKPGQDAGKKRFLRLGKRVKTTSTGGLEKS